MAPRTRRLALAGIVALTGVLAGCTHTVVFTNRSAEPVTVRGTEPGTLLQMFREDQEKTITLQPGESAELKVKHGAPIELEGRYALEIK
jgi:hypothetical protein